MKDVFCDVCSGRDFTLLDTKEGIQVRECSGCGLVYTSPRPELDDVRNTYTSDYYQDEYTKKYGKAYQDDIPVIEEMAKKRMEDIARFIQPPGEFLDIGCALGVYLNIAKQCGWTVSGVEISPFCAEFIKKNYGITAVHQGLLEEAGFGKGRFSVITMWLVLEHLADPNSALAMVREWMEPQGILGLKVPHLQGITGTCNRDKWLEGRPVDHSADYSIPTLSRLLEQNGFHVEKYYTEGIYLDRFRDAMERRRSGFPADSGSPEELHTPYRQIAEHLHLGDTLIMYARKV